MDEMGGVGAIMIDVKCCSGFTFQVVVHAFAWWYIEALRVEREQGGSHPREILAGRKQM